MADTIRLPGVISEIALSQGDEPRPIHMLRPGTFTDMLGREVVFNADDLAQIAARFSGKRTLPITERHDFGRSVGRLTKLWADAEGNLFGLPRWNKAGRELLSDEAYDGFSSELGRDDDGFYAIGGSLTNYPAVDGLSPVSLSAPGVAIEPALAAAVLPTEETIPMTIEQETVQDEPTPAATGVDIAALAAQITGVGLTQEMTTQLAALVRESVRAEAVNIRAQAEAEARAEIANFQREQRITALAQHMTTPTLQRQHALPIEGPRLAKFLNSLGEAQRAEAQAILEQVLSAGLISFEEIGNGQGDDGIDHERTLEKVEQIKAVKVASGMTASAALSAAISAVGKDAYNAARQAQKGGR
jgi:phage I-like protein